MKKLICFFIIIFAICLIASPGFSRNRSLPLGWSVVSTYTDPISKTEKTPITWIYSLSKIQDGFKLQIKDNNDNVGTSAVLDLDSGYRLRSADVSHVVRGENKTIHQNFDPQKPAFCRTSLAPADFLNILWDTTEWPAFFKTTEVIAGAKFASNFRLEKEPYSSSKAVQEKMISDDQASKLVSEELFLFRLYKITGATEQEVLSQLWSEDRPFWIYEKTEFRTSKTNF